MQSDVMVGNRLHKSYVSIRNNDYTLTECFEDNPELRTKINKLWENVTTVDTFFAKRDPTDEECEVAAQVCEEWCQLYPVYFPRRNLTRKMVEWSIVMPRFIREKKGFMNTVLRLEQEGEHLHQVLNSLETRFKSVYNKHERYFLILRELENKHYA